MTSQGQSRVVINLDTTNNDFDAPTITTVSGTAHTTSPSPTVSGTGSTSQSVTLSRSGSSDVILRAVIHVVTGFSFKFNGE